MPSFLAKPAFAVFAVDLGVRALRLGVGAGAIVAMSRPPAVIICGWASFAVSFGSSASALAAALAASELYQKFMFPCRVLLRGVGVVALTALWFLVVLLFAQGR